jgi:hypothetical protein
MMIHVTVQLLQIQVFFVVSKAICRVEYHRGRSPKTKEDLYGQTDEAGLDLP